MSLLDRFLGQLRDRGLRVERRDADTLVLCGPAKEKTPEVVAACKAFKKEMLARFAGDQPPVCLPAAASGEGERR